MLMVLSRLKKRNCDDSYLNNWEAVIAHWIRLHLPLFVICSPGFESQANRLFHSLIDSLSCHGKY